MSFDPITAALDIGGKIIDKIWPDPAQRAQAQLDLLKLAQTGELARLTAETDLAKAQAAINLAEAGNGSVFVSGWRPGVGWVCVLALFSEFIARPFLEFGAHVAGYAIVFPQLEMGDLLTLLLGMLGLGAYRTAEKIKGVAAK